MVVKKKESVIYRDFFTGYKWRIIFPVVVFSGGAILFSLSRGSLIHQSIFLQPVDLSGNISEVNFIDQAVTDLRTANTQNGLLNGQVNVVAYKPGPVSVTIDVAGKNPVSVKSSLIRLAGYTESRYRMHQVGEVISYREYPRYYLYTLAGLAAGFAVGLISALVDYYLKNY